MTLRSLRKLQTILWSTRPKTNGNAAGSGLTKLLRDAGLAGLAVLAVAGSTLADDISGRSRLDAPPVAQKAVRQNPNSSPDGPTARRVALKKSSPVRTAATTDGELEDLFLDEESQLPSALKPAPLAPAPALTAPVVTAPVAEATLPSRVPSAADEVSPSNAPQIAAQARKQLVEDSDGHYRRVEQPDSAFDVRMDQVLSGGVKTSPGVSLGAWWDARCDQLQNRNQSQSGSGQKSTPRVAGTARRMMDRVTLPDEPTPDVDFFDSSPIAVPGQSVRQVNAQEEEESSSTADAGPVSRLKTDIRTIKPTLSYALKNIEADQLPDDFDAKIDGGEYYAREASPIVFQWAPTNLYHYPLYFEDPALERYGHTYHPLVQPFASTGRFATQLVGLPYQMSLHPVHSKEYVLGYYRPGECAPKKHYQIPFNEEAALIQAATVAGLILIIP